MVPNSLVPLLAPSESLQVAEWVDVDLQLDGSDVCVRNTYA